MPDRPAILQVLPALDAGGVERTTLEMAAAIVLAGGRALVASGGGRLAGALADAGAELIMLPLATKNPARMLANAAALTALIRRERVALVHARSRAPAWSAWLAARRTGVPLVTTYHGIYNQRGRLKAAYNAVMARGDRVIANSEATARIVAERVPAAAGRLVVIPRGIDPAEFDPARVAPAVAAALRAGWGVPQGAPLAVLPGRLTRWKGQHVAIGALAHVPGVHLALVGDAQGRDSYVAELHAEARRLGLAERVHIAGHARDMPAVYRAADIVLVPSTEPEAFGRVAIEAQAMGVPVVASALGALLETVRPGAGGWLVAPGDPAALAAAMAEIVALDAPARAAGASAARAHVTRSYTTQTLQSATLGVYDALLGTRLAAAFAARRPRGS